MWQAVQELRHRVDEGGREKIIGGHGVGTETAQKLDRGVAIQKRMSYQGWKGSRMVGAVEEWRARSRGEVPSVV